MTRSCLITFAAITFAAMFGYVSLLDAQTANPLSAEVKVSYTYVRNNLVKMAEKMPAENYSFKPVPEIQTFAMRVAHITDANMTVCSGLKGEKKSVDARTKTSKADLVAAMKASFAYCDGIFDSLTDKSAVEMVNGNLGGPPAILGAPRSKLFTLYNLVRHSNELYGYMAVYLRLKGIVPPTSEPL
jgi:hypothetical protein